MPWWQLALAASGAGVGPLVLGFLGWAWWHSTKEPPTTEDAEQE